MVLVKGMWPSVWKITGDDPLNTNNKDSDKKEEVNSKADRLIRVLPYYDNKA
jgi:hypothetical protein